jgi:hypothetical protein
MKWCFVAGAKRRRLPTDGEIGLRAARAPVKLRRLGAALGRTPIARRVGATPSRSHAPQVGPLGQTGPALEVAAAGPRCEPPRRVGRTRTARSRDPSRGSKRSGSRMGWPNGLPKRVLPRADAAAGLGSGRADRCPVPGGPLLLLLLLRGSFGGAAVGTHASERLRAAGPVGSAPAIPRDPRPTVRPRAVTFSSLCFFRILRLASTPSP